MPDVLLHLRLRGDSKSKVEADRAKSAARQLQCAAVRRLFLQQGTAAVESDRIDGAICTLLDKSLSTCTAQDVVGAIRLLDSVFEQFLHTYINTAGTVPTPQPLQQDSEAVRRLLVHSKEELTRAVLAVALTRFPDDMTIKQLASRLGTHEGANGGHSAAASLLKGMLLSL